MLKNILLIHNLFMFYLIGSGQDTIISLDRFIINKSNHDGFNLSKFDIERGGEFIFEIQNQVPKRFINNSRVDNTSSLGSIEGFKIDTLSVCGDPILEIRSTFIWNFKNDYDIVFGKADILLVQKFTNYGIDFYLKMILQKTKERMEYWGYKEGTRDEYLIRETIF